MADNIAITPGTGATVATDEVSGRHFQLAKIALGADGVDDGPVSRANPMPTQETGELVEALEAMRMSLQSLIRMFGGAYPDTAGRLRIALEALSAGLTLATVTTVTGVTTVTTVTTVGTVTNQAQIGGIAANQQIPSLTTMAADNLRRNISVT